MAPVLHFKDQESYRKNLAYRHVHDLSDTASEVYVAGRKHEVKHSKDPKRIKIDKAQKQKEAKRKRG